MSIASKITLTLLYAVPVVCIAALALRGPKDTSTAPNFVLLGTMTVLVALVVTIVLAFRTKKPSWPWIGAVVANLAGVLIAFGSIDFRGFGGGGH